MREAESSSPSLHPLYVQQEERVEKEDSPEEELACVVLWWLGVFLRHPLT